MKGTILLSLAPFRLLPEFREQLLEAGGGRELLVSADEAEIEKHLDRVEIGMGDIPAGLIPRMPCFKWWQLWSAGADVLQRLPELKALPFEMSTTSGIHGQQIAEHLFAMLLGWNRRLPEAFAAQKRREWLHFKDDRLAVLTGKTMLIAGYGAIGKTIAAIAASFGLRVIGLRRGNHEGNSGRGVHGEPQGTEVQIALASELHGYLPQADYVVNILPSTPDTRHYFAAAEFSLMKNGSLYINVGRGATTCEADLVSALRERRIAGALLDVTETEPLPPCSPLWDLDNVIITGHYAGCHPDYSRMAMAVALDNLRRYRRGEPLRNLVDKQKGY